MDVQIYFRADPLYSLKNICSSLYGTKLLLLFFRLNLLSCSVFSLFIIFSPFLYLSLIIFFFLQASNFSSSVPHFTSFNTIPFSLPSSSAHKVKMVFSATEQHMS